MALKNIDFKQFLLAKGERVGLGVAIFLAAVFLLTSLFWPGHGVFSGSSSANAKALRQVSDDVTAKLNNPNNKPQGNDLPPPDPEKRLAKLELDTKLLAAKPYELPYGFVEPSTNDRIGRRLPRVLAVNEAAAREARVPIKAYAIRFNDRGEPLFTALVEPEKKSDGGSGPRGGMTAGRFMNRFGGAGGSGGSGGGGGRGSGPGGGMGMMMMGGGPGMRGGMGRMGGGNFGMAGNLRGGEERRGKRVVEYNREDLAKHPEAKIALQPRGTKQVIIVGSFPYKAQVDEFRRKLGLRSPGEVIGEASMEKGRDGQELPSFRFLGLDVQRRPVGPDGTPLKGWANLDVQGEYRPYVVLTGREFEPEDPSYEAISFTGLVMPRLKEFHDDEAESPSGVGGMVAGPGRSGGGGSVGPARGSGPFGGGGPRGGSTPEGVPAGKGGGREKPHETHYPDVAKDVKNLQDTLAKLKDRDPKEVIRPDSKFSGQGFDVFNPHDNPEESGGAEGAGPGGAVPPGVGSGGMRPGSGPGGKRPGGVGPTRPPDGGPEGPEGRTAEGAELPEYCMVRVIDVNPEPGTRYEYRLRVRMANPNYKRTRDVASPDYSSKKELESDWSGPVRVYVQPDLRYYVVDEKKLNDKYRGLNANVSVTGLRRVVLQAHRWLDTIEVGGTKVLVGDWAVAERVPVYRGDYVGRKEKVDVPYWRANEERFVLASSGGRSRMGRAATGIDVPFGGDRGEGQTVLVDFDNGRHQYNRVAGKNEDGVPTYKTVKDDAEVEVLMLSPDGKLLARDSAHDVDDKDRVDRVKAVRERIKEVREGKKDAGESRGGAFGGRAP